MPVPYDRKCLAVSQRFELGHILFGAEPAQRSGHRHKAVNKAARTQTSSDAAPATG